MFIGYDPDVGQHDVAASGVSSFKCFLRAFYFSISTMSSTVRKLVYDLGHDYNVYIYIYMRMCHTQNHSL